MLNNGLILNDNIFPQEFQKELGRLFTGFGELKDFVKQLAEKSTTKPAPTRTATRGDTPDYHNDVETQIVKYFPINKYTMAMDWFIKQPIVQDFIHYEVMRKVYRTHPVFKPESDKVLGKYMDWLVSFRLQSHFGKATTRVCPMDYGRFAMPMVMLKIAEERILNLGKLRVPGAKDVAEFLKDRCQGQCRTKVLGSDFLEGSESVQEMAHRILAERVDFIQEHQVTPMYCLCCGQLLQQWEISFQWIFNKLKQPKWDFECELKKTKKLAIAGRLKDDPSFDGVTEPFLDDIEILIFDDMDKGIPLEDMDEARQLVDDLEKTGITKPMFPRTVWDVSSCISISLWLLLLTFNNGSFPIEQTIKAVVQPSGPEVAAVRKANEAKAKIKEARLQRRRATYKAKQDAKAVDEEDDDSEDDIEEEPVLDDSPTKDQPDTNETLVSEPSPEQVASKSRAETLQEIMGNVSDISSSSPSDQQSAKEDPSVSYNITGVSGIIVCVSDLFTIDHCRRANLCSLLSKRLPMIKPSHLARTRQSKRPKDQWPQDPC